MIGIFKNDKHEWSGRRVIMLGGWIIASYVLIKDEWGGHLSDGMFGYYLLYCLGPAATLNLIEAWRGKTSSSSPSGTQDETK